MKPKKDMKIVIVEDDQYYNKALMRYVHNICSADNFPDINFEISSYLTAQECLENFEEDTNIMILDYYLLNENEKEILTGEDIILKVKKNNPECRFIMISEQQNPSVTKHLFKLGVMEYIDKDTSDRNLLGAVLQKYFKNARRKTKQIQN